MNLYKRILKKKQIYGQNILKLQETKYKKTLNSRSTFLLQKILIESNLTYLKSLLSKKIKKLIFDNLGIKIVYLITL